MRWSRCLWVMCCWSLLAVAHAAVDLVAFASASGEVRFIVANAETRAPSGWLALGEEFERHRLSRFDAATDVLILEQGLETISLRLKQDSVETATPKRKVLSDGNAAERQRRQIPLWIDGWGNVSLGQQLRRSTRSRRSSVGWRRSMPTWNWSLCTPHA